MAGKGKAALSDTAERDAGLLRRRSEAAPANGGRCTVAESANLDILCQIKILMDFTSADKKRDAVLVLMIRDAVVTAQSYCHRKDIPAALTTVIRDIVIRRFKAENGEGVVESVKRGDTQVTYASPISPDTLTEQDKIILNAYRRLAVR